MKSSGVIYSRKRHNLKTGLGKTGRGITLGVLLVIASTGILPMLLGQVRVREEVAKLKKAQITFSDLLQIEADQAPQITEATYFTVEIPKIKAKAKVTPNVSSTDKYEYSQALSKGVAHSQGTFLPGMNGAVTLFAHSTDIEANISRYNAVFYRLDELVVGDQVSVWYLGKKYDYRVTGSSVVEPDDVEVYKAARGEDKLYLVTCTPKGTSEKRLIIEAKR